MKKMPRVYDLVVMNHELGATLYRVVEIGRQDVGLIDATIEDAQPKQRVQWMDKSLLMLPTRAQIARLMQGEPS